MSWMFDLHKSWTILKVRPYAIGNICDFSIKMMNYVTDLVTRVQTN